MGVMEVMGVAVNQEMAVIPQIVRAVEANLLQAELHAGQVEMVPGG